MVKAARGLSVGTMCPAPWGATLCEIWIPNIYHPSPLVFHPKTFLRLLFTLKACPDALFVTQKKQKPEGKDGRPRHIPSGLSVPHEAQSPTLMVRKVMWENSFTKPATCSPLSP